MDVSLAFIDVTHVSVVTWTLCITVCVLVLRLYRSDRTTSPPLPPSPRFCLPVLGHLLQLQADLRVPFDTFRKQFGDVYSIYMGPRYTVVIAGYKTLKEAFKTRSLFMDRPDMLLFDVTLGKKGILSASGEVWRNNRRFTLLTLKEFGLGRNIIGHKIHEEANRLLEAIDMEGDRPFDPRETLATVVCNVISSMAFGGTFKHGDPKFKKLYGAMDLVNKAMTSTGLASIMPFLANIPGDPLHTKQVARDADARFAFLRDIINEHLKHYDENIIEDYTSAFIKAMKQKQLTDEETNFKLDQLSGVISDLFLAGMETTTTALRWSVVCLISFPETQARMYDVINKHVGTERLPTLEDKPALTYVDAFIMEVLRYCNVAVTSLFYVASTDVQLNGYTIPEGSTIIPYLDSVLSDPQIWGDPDTFRPDRFLNEDGSIQTPDEFIPFFLGRRRCLGKALARMELFLFISAMVQNYIFECPDGEEVSMRTVDGIFGAAHEPKPFRVVAKSRHAQQRPTET